MHDHAMHEHGAHGHGAHGNGARRGPGGAGLRTGVMLCGHGSRAASAVEEFAALAAALPPFLPEGWDLAHGYLEFANPVIRVGLDRLRERGCERILAVPGMLFAAMHAKNDIPAVLASYAAEHGIEVRLGRELGVDPKMIAAAGARVMEAVARADAGHVGRAAARDLPRRDRAGRVGSGRQRQRRQDRAHALGGLGLRLVRGGIFRRDLPLVEPCLDHVTRLGYRRVVVFPYFLFSGILIDRIYGFTREVAARHPGTEFVEAGYLGLHPKVLETFAERATEQAGEVPPPNCLMCKYRVQVLGFEAEVGAVQESHHHHVEGQGASAPGSNVADCALCDTFCTGECRLVAHDHGDGHGHHHHGHHHHGHGITASTAIPTRPTRRPTTRSGRSAS